MVDEGDRLRRELEHHRGLGPHAEEYWNWDSPAGRRRADRRADLLAEAVGLGPGTLALEVGCGTGVFLEKVLRTGARVQAVDLTEDLLARARPRTAGHPGVTFVRGNAQRLPYLDASFDAVYGSSILHHLDLEAALGEVYRVLRPGGRMAFAEPNLLNPQIAFTYNIGRREWYHLSPDEMAFTRFHARNALARTGFGEVAVTPFDFLHPAVPAPLVGGVSRLGRGLERLPLVREIAGSLLLSARRA